MRRFVIVCSLVMVVSAASAQAQSLAAKEAEIRAAVPYASMLREIPTLTWQQYEAAVRDVARAQSGPTAAIPAVPSLGRNSTSSRTGSTTFYNSDDGVTGTAQRIGPTTYYNFSNGTNGTSQRIGQSTFSHFNNGSQSVDETTTRVGQYQFHNFSNGVSGTSTNIGNSTFHNFSNGTNCTTTRIGSYAYTNCY
jgi:hypothetical protein